VVQECGVHHIDLNFGCPVRKVTAKGGGSALPLRPKLFRRLVAAATAAAGLEVPVTVKLRMGLHPELITFLQVTCLNDLNRWGFGGATLLGPHMKRCVVAMLLLDPEHV
jgi:tRNA-dihydrouridine synthase